MKAAPCTIPATTFCFLSGLPPRAEPPYSSPSPDQTPTGLPAPSSGLPATPFKMILLQTHRVNIQSVSLQPRSKRFCHKHTERVPATLLKTIMSQTHRVNTQSVSLQTLFKTIMSQTHRVNTQSVSLQPRSKRLCHRYTK